MCIRVLRGVVELFAKWPTQGTINVSLSAPFTVMVYREGDLAIVYDTLKARPVFESEDHTGAILKALSLDDRVGLKGEFRIDRQITLENVVLAGVNRYTARLLWEGEATGQVILMKSNSALLNLTVDGQGNSYHNVIVEPFSSNVLIQGNRILNSGKGDGIGLYIPSTIPSGAPPYLVEHLVIRDNLVHASAQRNLMLYSNNSDYPVKHVFVEDNEFSKALGTNGGGWAVQLSSAQESIIKNNFIHDALTWGISIDWYSKGVTIEGNRLYNNGQGDIRLGEQAWSEQIVVANNEMFSAGASANLLINVDTRHDVIRGNVIRNGLRGIDTAGNTGQITIADNTIMNVQEEAIRLYDVARYVVKGNQVSNPSRASAKTYDAVAVLGSDSIIVEANVFDPPYNAPGTDWSLPKNWVYLDSGTKHSVVRDNYINPYTLTLGVGGVVDEGQFNTVRENIGFPTESFVFSGSVAVGVNSTAGAPTVITSPSGAIRWFGMRIDVGGTFGTGETVTVTVTATWDDGSTTSVSKDFTATDRWVVGVLANSSLFKNSSVLRKLEVTAYSNLSTTAVTVDVLVVGTG